MGTNPEKAALLAGRFGVRAYEDVDALLADVDAVAIALPPDVQAPLAARAARAGKHLFLDKPLALSVTAADDVVAAVTDAGVRSVVFFTSRFRPEVVEILDRAVATGGWDGGRATILGSLAGGPLRRLALAARARRALGRRAARAVPAAAGPRAGRPGDRRGRAARDDDGAADPRRRRGQHDDAEPGLAGLDLGHPVLRLGRLDQRAGRRRRGGEGRGGPGAGGAGGRRHVLRRPLRPGRGRDPGGRGGRRTQRAERPGPGARPDGRVRPVQPQEGGSPGRGSAGSPDQGFALPRAVYRS